MAMFSKEDSERQIVKGISYAGYERNVLQMEDILMKKYGYSRSQLHKSLVREKYRQEMVPLLKTLK